MFDKNVKPNFMTDEDWEVYYANNQEISKILDKDTSLVSFILAVVFLAVCFVAAIVINFAPLVVLGYGPLTWIIWRLEKSGRLLKKQGDILNKYE